MHKLTLHFASIKCKKESKHTQRAAKKQKTAVVTLVACRKRRLDWDCMSVTDIFVAALQLDHIGWALSRVHHIKDTMCPCKFNYMAPSVCNIEVF